MNSFWICKGKKISKWRHLGGFKINARDETSHIDEIAINLLMFDHTIKLIYVSSFPYSLFYSLSFSPKLYHKWHCNSIQFSINYFFRTIAKNWLFSLSLSLPFLIVVAFCYSPLIFAENHEVIKRAQNGIITRTWHLCEIQWWFYYIFCRRWIFI